jgi:membrane-associated phospholipid phosphatase
MFSPLVNVINLRYIYTEFLFALGYFSGVIFFLVVLFLLRQSPALEALYILGYLMNMILNHILKISFQEPRPRKRHITFIESDIISSLYMKSKDEMYGFPSGHMQDICYSMAFLFLVSAGSLQTWVWALFLGLATLTVLQRYLFKKHTLYQLFWGGITGALVATLYTKIIQEIQEA